MPFNTPHIINNTLEQGLSKDLETRCRKVALVTYVSMEPTIYSDFMYLLIEMRHQYHGYFEMKKIDYIFGNVILRNYSQNNLDVLRGDCWCPNDAQTPWRSQTYQCAKSQSCFP